MTYYEFVTLYILEDDSVKSSRLDPEKQITYGAPKFIIIQWGKSGNATLSCQRCGMIQKTTNPVVGSSAKCERCHQHGDIMEFDDPLVKYDFDLTYYQN